MLEDVGDEELPLERGVLDESGAPWKGRTTGADVVTVRGCRVRVEGDTCTAVCPPCRGESKELGEGVES